jgi:predicted nucleotidyltransferase
MFKTLMEGETKFVWKDGVPNVVPRKVTLDLIKASLSVTDGDAQRIHTALVAEEWIEPGKFVPTRRGMALAQHIDRPHISRAAAEEILDRVLHWADSINADEDARVKLRAIYLFGSLERGEPEVGDIDLFVEFMTLDLGDNVEPKDMDRERELFEELTSISDYISPSSELDRKIMSDVPCRQVFPRPSSR